MLRRSIVLPDNRSKYAVLTVVVYFFTDLLCMCKGLTQTTVDDFCQILRVDSLSALDETITFWPFRQHSQIFDPLHTPCYLSYTDQILHHMMVLHLGTGWLFGSQLPPNHKGGAQLPKFWDTPQVWHGMTESDKIWYSDQTGEAKFFFMGSIMPQSSEVKPSYSVLWGPSMYGHTVWLRAAGR